VDPQQRERPAAPEPLAYGVFCGEGSSPRLGMRYGERVIDLLRFAECSLLDGVPEASRVFAAPRLNDFMELGPSAWSACLDGVQSAIDDDDDAIWTSSIPLDEVTLLRPFDVGDFVDFYASKHHAGTASKLLRPGSEIPECWPYLPLGYHSRGGNIVVSGEPVHRPWGQFLPKGAVRPVYGETQSLDFELELGFVVGVPSDGSPVRPADALAHVFGLVLLNDWSARDIQVFESRPLGPFLGKAFATSIAPWVVPVELLVDLRVPAGVQDPAPLDHLLVDIEAHVFDLPLEAAIRSSSMEVPDLVCQTNARHLYWSVEQQIAHLTSGGARLRTGDLLGSGTISGPDRLSRACMLEITDHGATPLVLSDGTSRTYVQDGDEVVIRGHGLGTLQSLVVAATRVPASSTSRDR
jgi:fumarylacetoacetase